MPVKHDLFADLHIAKDEFEARKKTDPALSKLHEDYNRIDKEVIAAEDASSPDEKVTQLRLERLKIKDKIESQLKKPS